MIADTAHPGYFTDGTPDASHVGFFVGVTPDPDDPGFFLVSDGVLIPAALVGFFDPSVITRDYQFEIDGYTFGKGLPIEVNADGFQPGRPDTRSQDVDNPAGGQLFGQVTQGAMSWLFNGFVNDEDDQQALLDLEAFSALWQRPYGAGEVSVLRYRLGGRLRRVYGQSRRFAQTFDNRLIGGYLGLSFEFKSFDGSVYDDEERSRLLTFIPPTTGGLISPLISPLTTAAAGDSQTGLEIGGRVPAPFVATITGPISNGVLSCSSWKLVLARSLSVTDVVKIDTTPWGRGIYLNGQRTTGLLSPSSSRLGDARLDPNGDAVSFGGVDPTGTSVAEIRWRPTYTSV